MHTYTTRRRLLGGVAAGLSVWGAGCLSADGDEAVEGALAVADARQYSAPGCGCCSHYAAYLEDNVEGAFEETVPEDPDGVKRRHGVPSGLRSCHTVVLDEYVVEGHVPVEAIATLLEDEPAIDGIALPGMPAGSPGMGGQKRGAFVVYALGGGRTGEVFAEL